MIFTENAGQFGSLTSLPLTATLAQTGQGYGVRSQVRADTGAIVWTSNGPEGGDIRALAIDPATPSTLYAGTGYGGVFKSTDGGENWEAVNTGLLNLKFSP